MKLNKIHKTILDKLLKGNPKGSIKCYQDNGNALISLDNEIIFSISCKDFLLDLAKIPQHDMGKLFNKQISGILEKIEPTNVLISQDGRQDREYKNTSGDSFLIDIQALDFFDKTASFYHAGNRYIVAQENNMNVGLFLSMGGK